VAKHPSVGAKSVSFAEEGPDNQRQSEQNQSVETEKQGLTQSKRQNSASEQNQSLIARLLKTANFRYQATIVET